MFLNLLSIFIGGGAGSVLRFLISLLSKKYFLSAIFATFFVNAAGCFLIGYIFGAFIRSDIFPDYIKLFIISGFLGGFTTFSTFSLEAFELLKEGKTIEAIFYIFSSLVFGLLFTYFGFIISGVK